jgi:uncharacterized protein YceK
MRSLILLAVLLTSGCGTVRYVHRNCQPVLTQEEKVDLHDPTQEWVCDEPWYRR